MGEQTITVGHTPTPWKISNYRPYNIIARDPDESTFKVGDDKFSTLVSVHGEHLAANAAFIVEAVNSYDSLRDRCNALEVALRGLLPYLSTEAQLLDYASMNEGRASGFDMASVKAREALAEGEEEKTPVTEMTVEERAEFALDMYRDLFSEPQFRQAVKNVANQIRVYHER